MGRTICDGCDAPISFRRDAAGELVLSHPHICDPADIRRVEAGKAAVTPGHRLTELEELREAVARLTTEKAAVEEAARCPWCSGGGSVPLGGYPDVNGFEREGPCPCDDGTAAGAFVVLKRQLEAAEQFREQVIHDIEALPRYGASMWNGVGRFCEEEDGSHVDRSAVLRILRGSDNQT